MKHPITPAQRRRIISAIRYYRSSNRYTGVTSVRVQVNTEYSAFVSVVIETRRSDCDRYSPRQVICRQRMHAMIGRRGGMKIASADDGLRSNLSHVRHMLRAS